jgi:hypothetical protein
MTPRRMSPVVALIHRRRYSACTEATGGKAAVHVAGAVRTNVTHLRHLRSEQETLTHSSPDTKEVTEIINSWALHRQVRWYM